MPNTLRALYIKSTAFAGMAKVFLALSGVITIWQLNALLDKSSFGAFMMVFAVCQIIAATLATAFQSLILYHVSHDDPQAEAKPHPIAQASLGLSALLSFLTGLLIFFAAPFWAKLLNQSDLTIWFQIMAGFIPAFTINMILTGWQRALQNIKALTLYNEIWPAAIRIIGLAALGFIPAAPQMLWLIGGVFVASYFLPFAFLYAQTPLPPSLNISIFSRWDLHYGLQSSFGQFINKSTRNLVIVLSGAFAGTTLAADFAIATRFGQLLLIPKNALVQLLTPRIRMHLKNQNFDQLDHELSATRALMLTATLIGICAYILFAEPVLTLFGDYGAEAYSILILLSIASLIRAAFGDAGGYIAMAGYAGWAMIIHSVSFLILLAGFTLLVPILGGNGAAYATILAVLFSMSAIAVLIWQKKKHAIIHWPDSLVLVASSLVLILYVHGAFALPEDVLLLLTLSTAYGFSRIKLVARTFKLIKPK